MDYSIAVTVNYFGSFDKFVASAIITGAGGGGGGCGGDTEECWIGSCGTAMSVSVCG